MGRTDKLREQHIDLSKMITEISSYLANEKLKENSTKVRSLLSSFAGIFKVHLGIEESTLYPELSKHPDIKVKTLAKKYLNEMMQIKLSFENYMKKWPTANSILGNTDLFIKDTNTVMSALLGRFERENNELYPMLDFS